MALCISLLYSQQREVQPVVFKKISKNLYEIHGGSGAQGGLYIGDNGILIIDAKQDKKSFDDVIGGIKKITDKPILYLINTHSDGDHIFGNRFFPETVTIIAHENCREEFFHPTSSGKESAWKNPDLAPFTPSITFKEKMDIWLGSQKVELWYFGVGHTKGDAFVYFPGEKAVFIGDMVFMGRPQLIHSYKGGNSFEYVKTMMEMLRTLDAEKFYSGHSDVITREQLNSHISSLQKCQEKVKNLINEGKNLEEIKSTFEANMGRLVTSIYNEITN